MTPQNSRKIVNRKVFEIIELLKSNSASACFPTATYCTENERTPLRAELAKWKGPGQLLIWENQEIKDDSKGLLEPLEFVGDGDEDGRRGFYPGAQIAGDQPAS